MGLVGYFKSTTLPGIILPVHFYIGYLGMARTFFAPLEHSLYPILISFKHGLYGSFGNYTARQGAAHSVRASAVRAP